MENKYITNYKLIFIIMIVVLIISVSVIILAWNTSLLTGIFTIILYCALGIYGVQGFLAEGNIKSVTITINAIKIEYRKIKVTVPLEDCARIEHYKRGPFTERICIYAEGYIYEIPWDIKDFRNMCENLYQALSNINMAHITDEWFHNNFAQYRGE
ncbi:MAG: hypothetical protein ACOYJD_03520 [Christensenellales bacterium]